MEVCNLHSCLHTHTLIFLIFSLCCLISGLLLSLLLEAMGRAGYFDSCSRSTQGEEVPDSEHDPCEADFTAALEVLKQRGRSRSMMMDPMELMRTPRGEQRASSKAWCLGGRG